MEGPENQGYRERIDVLDIELCQQQTCTKPLNSYFDSQCDVQIQGYSIQLGVMFFSYNNFCSDKYTEVSMNSYTTAKMSM